MEPWLCAGPMFQAAHDFEALIFLPGMADGLARRRRSGEFRRPGLAIGIGIEQGAAPLVQSTAAGQENTPRRARRLEAHDAGAAHAKALFGRASVMGASLGRPRAKQSDERREIHHLFQQRKSSMTKEENIDLQTYFPVCSGRGTGLAWLGALRGLL